MAEYWLISAPGDKTMQQTWETMNNVTSKQNNLCVNYKFHIPDLKVSAIRNRLVEKEEDVRRQSTQFFINTYAMELHHSNCRVSN